MLVTAWQVGLILLIILVMPRSAPKMFGGSDTADSLVEEAEGKATGIKAASGTETFAVVFDAGSTGQLSSETGTSCTCSEAELFCQVSSVWVSCGQ